MSIEDTKKRFKDVIEGLDKPLEPLKAKIERLPDGEPKTMMLNSMKTITNTKLTLLKTFHEVTRI